MDSDETVRKVRVFVSSPGDVGPERDRIDLVAKRLDEAFKGRVRVQTVLWERKIYGSHDGFQGQIPPAAKADLVIAIFWARLGSPLSEKFARMETGERYPSGTAFEVLTALDARRKGDRPDVYVFRKTAPPNETADEDRTQRQDLDAFFQRWFQAPDGQYLRAYQRFANADEFEQQVERLLRQWIAENVPRDSGVIWPIETEGSPFRGLLPFDARHASIYFGRDRKITRAIEQLQSVAKPQSDIRSAPRNIPFLLIVGESGAGKSSLMRAGLAPRLTAPGVVPSVDVWRTAVVRIGDDADPFHTLAKALYVKNDEAGGFGAALPELQDGAQPTAAAFADLLAQGGGAEQREGAPACAPIVAALTTIQSEEMQRRHSERDLCANLLLLIDQFENIFSGQITADQRAAFARLLFALCATGRVWAVATVRSDIYPRLIEARDFLALKDAGSTYDLAAPGPSELTEIVHKSAAAAGLVYEKDARTGKALDERILEDAQGDNMLPLLEFALQRLFEKRVDVALAPAPGEPPDARPRREVRLTFDAYKKMNRLDGAINETAKAALGKLGDAEVAALPRLLRCLAAPVTDRKSAGTAPSGLTVRMVPRTEAVPDDATARLVDALIGARIIVTTGASGAGGGGGGDATGDADVSAGEHSPAAGASKPDAGTAKPTAADDLIGIAHQRVFESWEDARNIIADNRDFFRIRQEVADQFRRWQDNARPPALLLAKGLPLLEAEKIVKAHGSELGGDIRDYVAASSRRARLLNVIVGTAAAVFFALFVVSAVLGLMTRSAQQAASANYQASKGALGSLITLITNGLRDTKGIEVATVQNVLSLVDQTIAKVQAVSGGDPELSDIRADMLYQGGKMFQKKQDSKDAIKDASDSLTILSQITGYDKRTAAPAAFAAAPAARRWDLVQSIELIGDLLREQKQYPAARGRFEEALGVDNALVSEAPDNDDWAQGVSQLYTRIGDVDVMTDLDAAQRDYQGSMAIAAKYFQLKPDNVSWQRELAWPYAKFADVAQRRGDADTNAADADSRVASYSAARDALENSLCLRRQAAAREPAKTEYARDVSYTLDRVGAIMDRLRDTAGAELAYFESLAIRRGLAGSVADNALYLGDVALSLTLIGDHDRALGNTAAALAFYDAAAAARETIVGQSPTDRSAQQNAAAAHKKADDLQAQLVAGQPTQEFAGAWWLTVVSDAEAASAKLRATAGAAANDCMDKVVASVDQAVGPVTTATVH